MADQERGWFDRLRGPYRQLFPAEPSCSEVFLFRVSRAAPPTNRSIRRPVGDVVRYVRDQESGVRNQESGIRGEDSFHAMKRRVGGCYATHFPPSSPDS